MHENMSTLKGCFFAGLDPLPLWELLKFDFLEISSVKIKPAFFHVQTLYLL